MEDYYTYLIIGGIIVIAIGIMTVKKFTGSLSKKGLKVSSDDTEEKDSTKIENIKNKSKIEVDSPKNRNIKVKDVDNSVVKIKK